MLERVAEAASRVRQREFEDVSHAAQALAQTIARHLDDAIRLRGRASLLVSGGRSPIPLFEALRVRAIEWAKVCITLADERWVDPASADSNEHLLREYLLKGAAASARFVPLKSPHADPAAALDQLDRQLQNVPRPLDVVMLGMGDDGHTASLFAGSSGLAAALDPRGRAHLVAMTPPSAEYSRISHTVASLLDSRQIYLLLSGAKKRVRFAEALAGASPLQLPIAAILGQKSVPVDVYWGGA